MKYGLIGEKLGHSFSPHIHSKIGDYPYELCELDRAGLDKLMRERDFCGINVTIPYKKKVMIYLDSIDDAAKRIGAVNTVVNRGGKLYGYNTDYSGARAMINRAGIELKGKKVLILGTGGTSATLCAVASDMEALGIIIVSRTASDDCIDYEEAVRDYSDAEIIINTTPVGMFPNGGGCPIDVDKFPALEGVVDVIYNPLKTQLIRRAEQRGIKCCGGLYMLCAQAVYAAEHFGVASAAEETIDRAFGEIFSEKQNIVLIGMPSSGKSTVGARLAELTGRELFDTDAEIVRVAEKTVPEIFAEVGESGFRRLEAEAVASLSARSGVIIATGGGVVLNGKNVFELKSNGKVFLLDRSLELLTATTDRPLSSSPEALRALYDARREAYLDAADVIVNGDGSVDEVAGEILKKL